MKNEKCDFELNDCYGKLLMSGQLVNAKGIYKFRTKVEGTNKYSLAIIDKSEIPTIIEALTNALKVMKD